MTIRPNNVILVGLSWSDWNFGTLFYSLVRLLCLNVIKLNENMQIGDIFMRLSNKATNYIDSYNFLYGMLLKVIGTMLQQV